MLWGVNSTFDKERKPPFPPRNRKNVSQKPSCHGATLTVSLLYIEEL